MKKLLLSLALGAALLVGPATADSCYGAASAQGYCCKVCKKGKACGDSCIAADNNCSKPPGCACDG